MPTSTSTPDGIRARAAREVKWNKLWSADDDGGPRFFGGWGCGAIAAALPTMPGMASMGSAPPPLNNPSLERNFLKNQREQHQQQQQQQQQQLQQRVQEHSQQQLISIQINILE
jgi:hypothetical protein